MPDAVSGSEGKGFEAPFPSDHGAETANELIDEFDLELLYNIPPQESDYSNS